MKVKPSSPWLDSINLNFGADAIVSEVHNADDSASLIASSRYECIVQYVSIVPFESLNTKNDNV